MALAQATGDVEVYKLIREQEQSGCRKEDVQECGHNRYVFYKGAMYKKCGVAKSDECAHNWYFFYKGAMCKKCGLKK